MWIYNDTVLTGEENLGEYVGFVYLIENLTNGKKYVGKKLLQFTRTKTIKGKRKKTKIASDWLTYFGSNDTLKADVEMLGPENFKRTILRFCRTKGECSYYEAKYQFQWDVILSEDWYNSWITCKISRSHLPKTL